MCTASVVKGISGREVRRAEEDTRIKVSSSAPSLRNIEITNYFNYEPKFYGGLSRNSLPRIKNEVYVIDLDNKKSKETHWVSLFIDRNTAVCFDSFGIECIPQKVLNKIRDKSITQNIFRT